MEICRSATAAVGGERTLRGEVVDAHLVGRRVSLDLGKPWAPEKCQLKFFQLDSISRTLFD